MQPLAPRPDRQILGRVVLVVGLGMIALAEGGEREVIPAERDFMVRTWRKEHGLPDNRVLSLLVSREGFLWAGTRAGVARFDGQRFEVWSRSTHLGFTNDTCTALAEDPSGRIWVGTVGGVFEIGNEVEAHGPPAAALSHPPTPWSPAIHALLVSRRGVVYAATEYNLCARSPGGPWQNWTEMLKGPEGTLHTSVAESADGSLFIGTAGQLLRWEAGSPEGGASEWVEQRSAAGFVHALTVAADGRPHALIGSRAPRTGALHRWEADGWERVPDLESENSSNPLFLAAAGDGGVWYPDGFQRIARWHNGQVTSYSLSGALGTSLPLCAVESADGDLWVGTNLGGLVCLQPRPSGQITRREGLPHDNAWALLEATDGALWVGTDGGVARLDGAGVDVVSTASGLANDHVRALAEDARGRIWIGTGYGLSIWDRGALGALQFEGEWFRTKIRALLRTRDGAMWVGTAQGLQRIEQDRQWSWLPADGLPAEDVRVIHEDRHGSIWIGMEGGGLARFSEGRFARFGPAEGLSSQRVWALLGDAAGWLWIGTDRGLNCLHDGRITTVTTSQGLPDNVVNSLVEDRHGWFWIGHDAGVYRVRREDLVAVVERRRSTARCIPYDEDDGLLNREVNGQISQPAVIRRRDGQIAFATVAGVALFNPDRPPDITNGPPVRIERLLAGGRVVFTGAPGARPEGSGGGPLRIAPQARQPVEIRFAAPNFHAGEQTRFRYRLVGLNPGWADAGTTRSASFAHLRPGHYTFEVFAANHHGYASTQPAWLSFHLEPRLFERAGVQAGAGLLVGGAAMAFGLWRLREVRRLHRLAHETSLARERDRLARDLHDGLGASLTEISLISRGANAGRPESEAADERFELLRQRSAEALQSLRELIWTTNPKADTLESLLARLCEQAQQVLNAAAIRCRLDLPMDVPAIHVGPGFRRAVLLAALEAVTNAARHSQARQVILRCAVGDRTLQIEIVDDGVGFEAGRPPPSDVTGAHGLGLGSMRTRIEELGGRCDFDSQPGRGTRVRFTLPLRWS